MMPLTLPEKVAGFVAENELFSAPCHILVAVSGGADSMSLLHLLLEWRSQGLQVSAVHVHHGLRGETADRDEQFVRAFCAEHSVPLTVYHRDVATLAERAGLTIEEAGRQERYACFEQARVAAGADYIVTAHTADDQVETMLMRLVRGTGTDGLAGIPAKRGVIRRPLLSCRRSEIESYCQQNAVPFCTDETNDDLQFTRNRVRHQVLPLLRQMNPGVDEALLRLAGHIGQDVDYLMAVANDVDGAYLDDTDAAPVGAVVALPSAVRRRVIRGWFEQAGVVSYEETHIRAVEGVLQNGSGSVCLSGGVTAKVEYGHITFAETGAASFVMPTLPVIDLPMTVSVDGVDWQLRVVDKEEMPNVYKLFAKTVCDYDKMQDSLTIRGRQTGDRIHPVGRGVGKSLKKLMNEWRIPVDKRDGLPLICDANGIALIPGYTCDERVSVGEDTKHFLVWQCVTEQG